MQTSTHIRPALHYSQVGPGGWHCLCCAPQSGNKYAARAKAQLRRQAKKRERAAFVREQHSLLIADRQSVFIEREIEEADYYARMDAQDNADRQKFLARQRYLERMGEGTLFWEQPSPDTWNLERAWYDAYDQYGENWCSYTVSSILIDRQNFAWLVCIGNRHLAGCQEVLLPLMEHSIEEVQQFALLLLRMD